MFTMNNRWRLVDLPGYGFAQVAREDSSRFNHAVGNYLEHRPNLCRVFALIESGLPPQAIDIEFVEWLARNSVPFVLVFTKIDRVSPAAAKANIAAFMERIAAWFIKPPSVFTCSATTGAGRQDLLGVVDEALHELKEQPTPAPVLSLRLASLSPKARAKQNRKRRPDLNRPW